jgi:hypothetical protein
VKGGGEGTAVPRLRVPAGDGVLPRLGRIDQLLLPERQQRLLSALFRPVAGKVVVVRGNAPTMPSGTSPVPWTQAGLQLRYFSLCNNVYRSSWPVVANPTAAGGTEYGCRRRLRNPSSTNAANTPTSSAGRANVKRSKKQAGPSSRSRPPSPMPARS